MRKILYQMFIKRACLVCVLLGVSLPARSVLPDELRFGRLTSREGLSDMIVQDIYRDSVGYVWFGTLSGIDRFDGIYIRHYPYPVTGESSKSTYAFTETPQYGLVAGASNGLWRFDRKRDRFVPLFKEELSLVHGLASDGESLYVGTFSGLYRIRSGELSRIPVGAGDDWEQRLNAAEDLVLDRQHRLWAATQGGLVLYDPSSGKTEVFKVSKGGNSRKNYFQAITECNGLIYLGTPHDGLFIFDPATKRFSPGADVGSPNIKDMDADEEGMIYVSTDGNGLQVLSADQQRVDGGFCHDPKVPGGIASNSVYCFLKDREGILWFGYYLGGIDYTYYTNGLFRTYHYGAFDSQHYAIRNFWLGDGQMMVGTRSGLFYVSEERGLVREYPPSELGASVICNMTQFRDRFFVGTFNGGLWVIDPETLHPGRLSTDEALNRNDIYCLAQDTSGNLWMATASGVCRYPAEGGDPEFYTKENSGYPYDNAHYIAFDHTGNGWIAGGEGLVRLHTREKRFETEFPDSFPGDLFCFYIYPDSKGNILFLSFDQVFISDPGMTRFRSFRLDPEIGRYLSVVEDDQGYYWFSTNSGVYRTPDLTGEGGYQFFDYADNLSDLLFHACSARDSRGRLWFGNNHGLCYIDPAQVDSVREASRFPLVFSSVGIDGKSPDEERLSVLAQENTLYLSSQENTFSVSPVWLNFANPSSRKYEYRLDKEDTEWQVIEDGLPVTYTNLPAGRYTLTVRVKGTENQKQLTVVVRRGASFYLWILAAVAVLVLALWVSRRKKPVSPEKSAAGNSEKYKNTKRFSAQEARQIIDRLQVCMEKEKMYLNPALKSADLAARVECSQALLSQVFSLHLKESYYDFVNGYRVEEFKRNVREGTYTRYTLDALSNRCGFNSQASFFRSFRKMTGMTPNEYIQQVGEKQGAED